MITIHNLRKEKPETDRDIRIDRGYSPLSNPVILHSEKARNPVCDDYIEYIADRINYGDKKVINELIRLHELASTGDLRLFCWCAPKRCHGDTIKSLLSAVKMDKHLLKKWIDKRHEYRRSE